MKTYTLKQAIETNLLPWSTKTILRMRDRGEINLINIGHGKKNKWAITEQEIKRVIDKFKKERMNKMIDGKNLNTK